MKPMETHFTSQLGKESVLPNINSTYMLKDYVNILKIEQLFIDIAQRYLLVVDINTAGAQPGSHNKGLCSDVYTDILHRLK